MVLPVLLYNVQIYMYIIKHLEILYQKEYLMII
nr:MAG TPA: hypothetical protein [Caudoviricetes sp.]DAY42247.1 MAG TPA: hypothetical protein [Caudoviricetes sp.]